MSRKQTHEQILREAAVVRAALDATGTGFADVIETTPALKRLFNAALDAVEGGVPPSFELDGRRYWLRAGHVGGFLLPQPVWSARLAIQPVPALLKLADPSLADENLFHFETPRFDHPPLVGEFMNVALCGCCRELIGAGFPEDGGQDHVPAFLRKVFPNGIDIGAYKPKH